jgi:hypothetical protein
MQLFSMLHELVEVIIIINTFIGTTISTYCKEEAFQVDYLIGSPHFSSP